VTTADSGGSPSREATRSATGEADPRRWRTLAVLGMLQFMMLLDLTIVNVALPKIQTSLGFSQTGLAWVVNGYVLMAGGFLLLGGRLADIYGRLRILTAGVILFAAFSALSGAAVDPAMLVVGRFGQGLGEALAGPAALSLIPLLFTDHKERTKALGIWGGLTGLGGIMGYVISGLFTTYASWRWIFYINVPVAIVILLVLPKLITDSRMERQAGGRPDFTGSIIATAGLIGVVYGLLQAAAKPWSSLPVLGPLFVGACLLLAAPLIELRSKAPLIPLDFFANRTRTVANVAGVLFMAAFIPYSFMLTLFEQHVLDYSPLRCGLSYLPLGLGIGIGIGISTAVTPRVGIKVVGVVGQIGAAAGLFLTSMIKPDSTYVGGILPGMILLGISAGVIIPAMTSAALHKVTGQDSGLASAMQNITNQVGSALGLAVLVTLAVRHAGGEIFRGVAPAVATTDGYVLSFRIGAVLLVVCALLIAFALDRDVAVVDPATMSAPSPRVPEAPYPTQSQ
jgi:EmrB/QacA subfamily drug resistance transporter